MPPSPPTASSLPSFFFPYHAHNRDLHSFPTRRSSDLSRRIGLDTSGAPVPILAGGRLYGRLGPWRIGVLDAQTGGADKANDAVVRVQHDLFDRSYIGAIGTLHAVSGGQGVQRAGGVDLDLPLVVHEIGRASCRERV